MSLSCQTFYAAIARSSTSIYIRDSLVSAQIITGELHTKWYYLQYHCLRNTSFSFDKMRFLYRRISEDHTLMGIMQLQRSKNHFSNTFDHGAFRFHRLLLRTWKILPHDTCLSIIEITLYNLALSRRVPIVYLLQPSQHILYPTHLSCASCHQHTRVFYNSTLQHMPQHNPCLTNCILQGQAQCLSINIKFSSQAFMSREIIIRLSHTVWFIPNLMVNNIILEEVMLPIWTHD